MMEQDSRKDENLEIIRVIFIRNCDSPKIKDDRIKNHRLKQVDSSLFLALAQIRMKRPKTADLGLETPSNRSTPSLNETKPAAAFAGSARR